MEPAFDCRSLPWEDEVAAQQSLFGGAATAAAFVVACLGTFGVSQWQRLTHRERAALKVMAEFRMRKARKALSRRFYAAWSGTSSWMFGSTST
jgi:hypothetical protein